jgi:hypothetical protein
MSGSLKAEEKAETRCDSAGVVPREFGWQETDAYRAANSGHDASGRIQMAQVPELNFPNREHGRRVLEDVQVMSRHSCQFTSRKYGVSIRQRDAALEECRSRGGAHNIACDGLTASPAVRTES